MAKNTDKRATANDSVTAHRQKLEGLPFERASDLKKASDEIRLQVWKRFENARLFNELSQKPEYSFIREELHSGLSCQYGDEAAHLVKVFSDGVGVKIDINKQLLSDFPSSKDVVESLVRSMGDSFSKSYYQAKGILPQDGVAVEDLLRAIQKNK